jgi:DASH complex subunit DAD1
MATNRAPANGTHNGPEKSYYEQQRELLVTEIAQVRLLYNPWIHPVRLEVLQEDTVNHSTYVLTPTQSLELVLQNINKLNRSLEEVTQVGNEFAPVESLWSHFENVMAKDASEAQDGAGETEGEGETGMEEEGK